jgi:hypothetical protein
MCLEVNLGELHKQDLLWGAANGVGNRWRSKQCRPRRRGNRNQGNRGVRWTLQKRRLGHLRDTSMTPTSVHLCKCKTLGWAPAEEKLEQL